MAAGLHERGIPIRRASRNPTAAADTVRFDWYDPTSWPRALAGAATVYIVTPMTPDFPAELVAEFAARSAAAGVRRLVLLSGSSAGYGSRPMLSREEALRSAGPSWTILRPGQFSQNFSQGAMRQAVLDGELRWPLGPPPGPGNAFIDIRDVAEVAVATMTGEGHNGQVYTLAGPRALSVPEALAEISAASGRHVSYVEISMDEWLARQRAAGVSRLARRWSLETFEALGRGEYAHLHQGVPLILGRPARDFADYTRAAAAAGVWD